MPKSGEDGVEILFKDCEDNCCRGEGEANFVGGSEGFDPVLLGASSGCEIDEDVKTSADDILEIALDELLAAIARVAAADEVRSFDVALDTDPGLLTGAEIDVTCLPFAAWA